MTERTSTVILVTGAVLGFLAAHFGLSAAAVAQGWFSWVTVPDLSRFTPPAMATTPATAIGWSVGVWLILLVLVALACIFLGSPRRARKRRAGTVSRHRPVKLPARNSTISPQPASAGAGRGKPHSLRVPPTARRYTAGRARVLPGPGPASTTRFPAVLRGHGRTEVTASRPGGAVEAVTSPLPRLPGEAPLIQQSAAAPALSEGCGAGAAFPTAGGGGGVAREWAAAGRQQLKTLTARGDDSTPGPNQTTNSERTW